MAQGSSCRLVEYGLPRFTKNWSWWPLRSRHPSWRDRETSVSNQIWLGRRWVIYAFLLVDCWPECILKCSREASWLFARVQLHWWLSPPLFLHQLRRRRKATRKGVFEKFTSRQGESFGSALLENFHSLLFGVRHSNTSSHLLHLLKRCLFWRILRMSWAWRAAVCLSARSLLENLWLRRYTCQK